MRDLLNITKLNEGVTVRPAVLKDNCIDYPEGGRTTRRVPCHECNGTGDDTTGYGEDGKCDLCYGVGTEVETQYHFPHADISYHNCQIVADILGTEYAEHKWIAPDNVAAYLRRLIYIKNTTHDFTREPSKEQNRRVDRSGDVPQIGMGPKFIDFGVSDEQVERYIDTLIEIFTWAKRNGCGVSWA